MSTVSVISSANYYDTSQNNSEISVSYNTTDDYENGNYGYGDDAYVYEIFKFEVPIYKYIWEILVLVTSLVNIMVILVLMGNNMRNPNNVMLVAIAIADSLTGLITLPSYIEVFMKYEHDSSLISKHLCRCFMISKFYLSQVFHTMSIFLTVGLGCQRYICIRHPFEAQVLLNMRNTLLYCVCIIVLAPILHIYQAIDDKAVNGMCRWTVEDDCSGGGCAYLWVLFVLRHLIPCVVLVVVTTCFVQELRKGETTMRRMDSNSSQILRRAAENKKMCVIVLAIVIVFLIPEIPYGIYLFVTYMLHKFNRQLQTESNRLINMVYELALVLSFHANFYIYILFNKRFRKGLQRTLSYSFGAILKSRTWSISSSSFKTESHATGHTGDSLRVNNEIKLLNADNTNTTNINPQKHQVETLSFLDNSKDTSV